MDRQYLSVYTLITDESPPMGLSLATRQAHEVADTAGRVDSRGMNHFRIELHKQVVGEQWLTDCSTFATHDFFQGDHRCQAIHSLSFEVFLAR